MTQNTCHWEPWSYVHKCQCYIICILRHDGAPLYTIFVFHVPFVLLILIPFQRDSLISNKPTILFAGSTLGAATNSSNPTPSVLERVISSHTGGHRHKCYICLPPDKNSAEALDIYKMFKNSGASERDVQDCTGKFPLKVGNLTLTTKVERWLSDLIIPSRVFIF